MLNPFFDFYHQKNEQDFYKDFVDENIRLAGTETLFIPKDFESVDSILGEPYKTLYSRFYPMACLLTTPEGYGGEGDMMSQFGLKYNVTAEWVISKRIFRELNIPKRPQRPFEGDLLLIGPNEGDADSKDPSFTNSLFEITYVRHETPNWALGDYYVFHVVCQLYTASYEKFKTGAIDADLQSNQQDNLSELVLGINENLEKEKTTLVDFSEINPFGNL